MNVLVVDDSSTMRRIVRNYLRGIGYTEIAEAENGASAFEQLSKQPAGLVITDWNMPVMDGLSFLRAFRAEFGPDNPPVVFCTTENDMAHIAAAIESGAQEYIMKPFDEEILVGKLAQVGLS